MAPRRCAAAADAGGADRRATGWQGFLRALLLQLSNPKIMVFFGSIFLSLLPAQSPGWLDGAALAIVAVNEFTWFALLALLFSGVAPAPSIVASRSGSIA